MEPKEENLPVWAKQLIADLRRHVQYGNEPLLKEISQLRPQVELLKRRNEALTELLDCAAKGGHTTAKEIMDVISTYNLTLTKEGD